MSENLPALGAEAVFLTPAGFRSVPMPTYPDIRLALTTAGPDPPADRSAIAADHVHVVTEGPLGLAGAAGMPEGTAAVHDQLSHEFPEYLRRAAAGPRER